MNILVTGGAGYIGSHACKPLSAAGLTPVAFDNLVSGHNWAAKWGPLERGDILDRPRLDEILQKYRPSAVMHFAAYASVGESVEQPAKYYRNDVTGTLTLLEAMYDHDVKQMVFSSSCPREPSVSLAPRITSSGTFKEAVTAVWDVGQVSVTVR